MLRTKNKSIDIPGKYGFTSKIALDMSKDIQLNDENYTLIKIPDQDEIHAMLIGVAQKINDENGLKKRKVKI